jgi:hypothetical protein
LSSETFTVSRALSSALGTSLGRQTAKRRSLYRPDSRSSDYRLEDLGLARFETHLCWAPSLDAWAGFVRMPFGNNQLERFERAGFHAAKVRNVSRLGSQMSNLWLTLSD